MVLDLLDNLIYTRNPANYAKCESSGLGTHSSLETRCMVVREEGFCLPY